jgi:hypothetical protein
MTPKEAADALGFRYVSSVYAELRSGWLRARANGDIRPESVERVKTRRTLDARRLELFLKGTLTQAEQAELTNTTRPKMPRANKPSRPKPV